MADVEQNVHLHDDTDTSSQMTIHSVMNTTTTGQHGVDSLQKQKSVGEKSNLSISPAPDGGTRAWLQVLAAHLVVFNAWGYINSFGIFQSYYMAALDMPPSTISWIGSFQVFLVFFIGTFSGRALDAGYYRTIAMSGALLQLIGVLLTSLCTKYWQLFLAQGVCQGIGDGLIFCPSVSLVATYFSSRRAFAISTTASGAATGGIVFPLIAQQLLPKVGFGWTIRVMALVILVNDFIIFTLVRTRLPPRKSGSLVEFAAFKEPSYLLFTIGMWFVLWATYFAYYYVRPYALDVLHVSQETSFTLLLILNAIGVPGRCIPALLADRYFGPMTVLIPCVLAGAVCIYAWISVSTLTGFYIWVVVFGWFGASIQGMFPSSLASLTKDPRKTGTRIGMVFTIISFACLTGPPLAGKLVQIANGSYIATSIWGGTSLVVGAAILVAARLVNKDAGPIKRDEK